MEFTEEQFAPKSAQHFPVMNVEETYYYDGKPDFVPGTIVHYFTGMSSNEKKHRFVLEQVVGGLTYILKLGEEWSPQTYGLSFKTEEYEYATVNLSEEGQATLGEIIVGFIENVSRQKGIDMQ